MTQRHRRRIVRDRIVEAAREIGTLLIAFAPLDFILAEAKGRGWLLIFLLLGIFLLSGAIVAEGRRARVR